MKKNKPIQNPQYLIYTDGGYSMKCQLGGFAYIILKDGKEIKRFAKKYENSTNNRGELNAILYAVRELPDGAEATIRSDSQYALGCLNARSGWHPTKNLDIIDEFKALVKEKKLHLGFEWVRGHSGNKWNEECDRMCTEVAGMDLNAEFEKYKKGRIRGSKPDNLYYNKQFAEICTICETLISAYLANDTEYFEDTLEEMRDFLRTHK